MFVFGALLWADRRVRLGHGRVFALYVAGYTLGRFVIELMRSDEATHILGLRVNTWVSALLFLVAVVAFVRLRRGRETPYEVDPGFNPDPTRHGALTGVGAAAAQAAGETRGAGSGPARPGDAGYRGQRT